MTGNLKRPHADVGSRDELIALGPEAIMNMAGFAATRAMVKGERGDTSLSRVETWALVLFARMFLPQHPDVHVPKREDAREPAVPQTAAGTEL